MSGSNDNIDFGAMLVEVSKHISDDELESMKFVCREFIGKRLLEKINTFLKLCDALESHGKLEEYNLKFLKMLLEKCTYGKKDASKVVEQYEAKQSGGRVRLQGTEAGSYSPNGACDNIGMPSPAHVLIPGHGYVTVMQGIGEGNSSSQSSLKGIENEANYLTRKLGREWRFFMRSLGVSDYDMSAAEQMYPRSLRDQIYASLLTWAEQEKGRVSKEMLVKALQDPSVERFDLAANIQDGNLK